MSPTTNTSGWSRQRQIGLDRHAVRRVRGSHRAATPTGFAVHPGGPHDRSGSDPASALQHDDVRLRSAPRRTRAPVPPGGDGAIEPPVPTRRGSKGPSTRSVASTSRIGMTPDVEFGVVLGEDLVDQFAQAAGELDARRPPADHGDPEIDAPPRGLCRSRLEAGRGGAGADPGRR